MEESVGRGEREDDCEETGGALALGVEDVRTDDGGGVVVSLFNGSGEQFISTTETISSLCRFQDEDETFDQSEIQRFSSMITFLKEWRYFFYEPKIVNFRQEAKFTPVKEDIKGIKLPQFSSAAIPKRGESCDAARSLNSKDFVLHAGGSVWALDWCPRMHEMLDCPLKCEYLAVAAHPPDSSYHKIGSPLTGRGIVQIWCILNMNGKYEPYSQKPRGHRNTAGSRGSLGGLDVESEFSPLRPRGRPRKRPLAGPPDDVNGELKSASPRKKGRPRKLPVAIEPLNDSSVINNTSPAKRPRGRPKKRPDKSETINDMGLGKESTQMNFAPALAVDDTHVKNVSLVKRPRGRPRKISVEAEKEDHLRAAKDLSNAVIISYTALGDSNAENAPYLPCKRRGRPRKKPVDVNVVEDLSIMESSYGHAAEDLNMKTESSPLRRPRGRPKKRPDEVANTDGQHTVQDPSIMVPAELINDSNIENKSSLPKRGRGRPRKGSKETLSDVTGMKPKYPVLDRSVHGVNVVVSDIVKEVELQKDAYDLPAISSLFSTSSDPGAQLVNDSNIENKSSLPKRGRGRPRKGSKEMLSDLTGMKPKCPVLDRSACDLNDVVVSDIVKEVELQKDAYDLSQISSLVNTSSDVLRGSHTDGRISTTNSTNLCIQGKDAYNLPSMDTLVNTSNSVVQEFHMDERISTRSSTNLCTEKTGLKATLRTVSDINVHPILSTRDMEAAGGHAQVVPDPSCDMAHKRFLGENNVGLNLQNDVALPRVVLCLGHNGKVAWDVKWRPCNTDDNFRHRMGYLAVLLGNGSLEVWEVPQPSLVKNLYKSSSKEGTDPRFLKVRPVFRCSKLKIGDRQSIPLTMEWSRSTPYDLMLVGCHDGTVALWRFSAEDPSQDTRPLLCFTADTVPIRAVAWAPGGSDSESANLIVTAGHEGLKFWDIRDPYRPLWDFNPAQKIILSLVWLQHPSCLIFSSDDGTVKTLSLWKAANDVPVTGKPFDGARRGVLHTYYRSQFAIWSVQVSPVTGVAAYCCADGSTLCFEVTAKSVDKDKHRHHSPHFLCGALSEIDHSLTIDTPLPYAVVAELPRSTRGLPSHSNCATLGEDTQVQGEDPAISLGDTDCELSASRKMISQASKCRKPCDNNQIVDLSNTVGDRERENLKIQAMNTSASNQNFLFLPPKIVAMHKVRWNVNKGSERWLCYAGAAGIVRCQEIALPSDF